MNEKEFGRRISNELNAGLARLNGKVGSRLELARREALAAMGGPAKRSVTTLAVAGGWLGRLDGGHLRHLASGLALLACLGGAYFWLTNASDVSDDDVDAILLADDLPPQAYVDHQFDKWLNR